MKISEIYIKNFRSIKEETIIFPQSGILSLVGANNAGKSNILKAINNILGDNWFSKDRAEKNDYYNKDFNNNILIKITFDDGKYVELDFKNGGKWPSYYDENGRMIYSSQGNVKDDFPCTFLPAERSLEKNLQFRSYELMGKIAKSFNEKAQNKKVEIETKFGEVMDLLNEVEGFSDFKKDFVAYFNEMQADTPYRLKVDFKAFSPLNYFKTINILANDSSVNNEYDIDVDELGEGNKSLLLFALLRSYAKNFKQNATGILAVEEPEIYLHPQARRHLYEIFFDIVNNSNIQIVYSTHSPDFLATENFDSIGLVSKSSLDGTLVKTLSRENLVEFSKQTGVPEAKTSVDNITEFYATTSNYRLSEGFFAKILFLVEGETEELCLPILFKQFGINTNSAGITFIAVNGKNQIPKYWRLFYSFGIQTEVLIDNDDDASGDKRDNNNISSCFNFKVDSIVNLEESTNIKDIQTSKDKVFNQRLFVLKKDFETTLKADYQQYCKDSSIDDAFDSFLEDAKKHIKPTGKAQKGQVSRYVIKKIIEQNPKYKPKFIEELINKIGILNEEVNSVSEGEEGSHDDGNEGNLPF